ncbi:MAG: ABC transporter ATP-binding protein [Treponema sp.]|jgi:NitT/TauT family transport system ATP-binding protein|nr:ABC transporter ATP-binding protein [Treponema sp.]
MVKLQNLSIDYEVSSHEKVAALANVDADFPTGKISALLGSSGCGKTSIIHVMAGLLQASRGNILINGETLQGVRKSTAIIFQDFGLLPWKSAYANVELPLKFNGLKKKQRRELTLSLLKEFGLEKSVHLYPKQLSGGMKQRLAIARSLVADPDLLLMDEPFSSLDALTREAAQDFLLEITAKRKITIVIVTHSIDEAVYLADSVYIMTGKNPGTIMQHIDLPARNKNTFREDLRFQECCMFIRNALKEDVTISKDDAEGHCHE